MAITIINNLYPPIVATWMPAFVRTAECKVYFSLSAYNSPNDIAANGVQVMISNQNSSLSAFDTSVYTSEIKLCTLEVDNTVSGDAKYFITINAEDLKNGYFEIGQYYKVQIRFTSSSISVPDSSTRIAEWLSNNSGYFSEWSTVCLVHGIEQPLIYLREFDGTETASLIVFNTSSLSLTGQMYYDSEYSDLEDESMQSYCIDIYNVESGNLIYSTGDVFTNEYYPNEINYILKYSFEAGIEYQLIFSFETRNGYQQTLDPKNFLITNDTSEQMNVIITATGDPDNGRILIHAETKESEVFIGNICIRRTSSETNFTIWEDMHIEMVSNQEPFEYNWYDYTAKSGIYYYYGILQIQSNGTRGEIVKTHAPTMLYLDDIFLTRADMQLRVRFDPQISSYQVTLSESKTDTIGSRYPHFSRNGNIAYKQFPISGLIMSYCDEDQLFSSPEEFYGDMSVYYDSFNEETERQILPYQDYIYERNFREKIMKFLYDDNIKLFRSLTEGNILIKLMDISFTPNQTLGRMLYSFSATAYEIDECSIENYINYGILEIGDYITDYDIAYEETKMGEIADVFDANEEIYTRIINHFQSGALLGYIDTVTSVTCLKIDFQSNPYLIVAGSNGSLTPATSASQYSENLVYGYIVYINNESFLISPRGYFVVDPDVEITSITFPVETNANIDFMVKIQGQSATQSDNNKTILSEAFYTKVGQISGIFDVNESIFHIMYLKHRFEYDTWFQKLISIDEITIEANPGTVCYIKDSFEDTFYRHIVGKTSTLHLYDSETVISSIYVGGIHLSPMRDDTRLIPAIEEYRDTGIVVADVSEIKDPQERAVYTITNGIEQLRTFKYLSDENGDTLQYQAILQELAANTQNRYIYMTNDWFTFTDEGDALCPVEAIITYIYEVEKGDYEQ